MEKQEIDFGIYLKEWEKQQFTRGVPDEEYHRTQAMSAGQLKRIVGDSVAHFRSAMEIGKKPPSPAMRFGALFHKACLEGPEFLKNYKVIPEFTGKTQDGRESVNSKEAKEKKKAWLADLPQGTILVDSAEELDQITGMITAVLAHPIARHLLRGGERELSGWFNYQGVRCKMRVDILSATGRVADLKTTICSKQTEFEKSAWNELYPIQAALYRRGVSILTGKTVESFDYIVVEKTPPFPVEVFTPSEAFLSLGDHLVELGLAKIKKAITENNWQASEPVAKVLDVPAWAMKEVEGMSL